MPGAPRDDYVTRQIRTMAEMIARMMGLRLSGQPDEARAELERSYELLAGSQSELIRRVDPATAATLLGSRQKIRLLARLAEEEAALETDEARRAHLLERAAKLAAEDAHRAS